MSFLINAKPATRLQDQKVTLEVIPKPLATENARMSLEKCKKLAEILEVNENDK